MLKKLFVICLCALLLAPFLPTVARAEQAALDVVVTPSPSVLDGTGEVQLDFRIMVSGSAGGKIYDFSIFRDMTELINFASISAGETVQGKSSVPLTIAQSDLNTPIELRCFYKDVDGEYRVKTVYFTVRGNTTGQLKIERKVTPEDATPGSLVTLSYTLRNNGSYTVTNIKLYDAAINAVSPISVWPSLEPGESVATSAALAATAGLKSAPYATFESDYQQQSVQLEGLSLTADVAMLSVTVKADSETINMGDAVTLTCTLLNEGTVAIRDIKITEPELGALPGTAVLEPGKSYVIPKKIVPVATKAYIFSVEAKTASGEAYAVQSAPISVEVSGAAQPQELIDLRISATPAVTEIDKPGDVMMDISVRNLSDQMLKNIVIREEMTGTIEELLSLPKGDKVFKYSLNISRTTTFKFTIEAHTETGALVVGTADPVTITLKTDDISPTPYVWAEPTPSALVPAETAYVEPGGGMGGTTSMLFNMLLLIGALIFVCVIALVILWLRDRRRASAPQYDPQHFDDEYEEGPFYEGERYSEDVQAGDDMTRAIRREEPSTQSDDRTRAVKRRPGK